MLAMPLAKGGEANSLLLEFGTSALLSRRRTHLQGDGSDQKQPLQEGSRLSALQRTPAAASGAVVEEDCSWHSHRHWHLPNTA
jgi:hypothetical protein